MSTPFSAATAAYGQAQRLVGQGSQIGQVSDGARSQGPDFAKILAENVQSVVEQGEVTNQKTLDLVAGKGDVVDVVTALSQTEFAIQSMVTIRDRVISAYEEIMRMPI